MTIRRNSSSVLGDSTDSDPSAKDDCDDSDDDEMVVDGW